VNSDQLVRGPLRVSKLLVRTLILQLDECSAAFILVGSEEERGIEKGRVYCPALTGSSLDSLKVTVDEINVRSAELKTRKWKSEIKKGGI
jgi:hypothetical protein